MRISLLTALFIFFLTLKLTENINWSWWWVTAPLWAPFALTVLIIASAVTLGILIDRPDTNNND